MSQETRKVLEMLAAKQITVEDAEKLLEQLGAGGRARAPRERDNEPVVAAGHKLRFLRVVVDSPDSDRVNIRVPLAFVRTGIRLLAVLPPRVNERLGKEGIDLSALRDLQGPELTEALEELNVDIDADDGKKVRVFCE